MTNINTNGITNSAVTASEIDWNKNVSSGIKLAYTNIVIENGDFLWRHLR